MSTVLPKAQNSSATKIMVFEFEGNITIRTEKPVAPEVLTRMAAEALVQMEIYLNSTEPNCRVHLKPKVV